MRGKVQKIVITHSKDGIYYANLVLEREGTVMEIDARPATPWSWPKGQSPDLCGQEAVPGNVGSPEGGESGRGSVWAHCAGIDFISRSVLFVQITRGVLVSDVRTGAPLKKRAAAGRHHRRDRGRNDCRRQEPENRPE